MKMVIDKLIKESGLKQKHIAQRIGVNENTLGNWMKNKSWPKLNQAVRLADILGCSVTDLYTKK